MSYGSNLSSVCKPYLRPLAVKSMVMLLIQFACVPVMIDKMERPIERSMFANARTEKASVYSRSPILKVVGFFNFLLLYLCMSTMSSAHAPVSADVVDVAVSGVYVASFLVSLIAPTPLRVAV